MSTNKKPKEMLKTQAVAMQLHQKRYEDKMKNNNKNSFINSAYIQVLGSNYQGFSPSLLVYSEGRSYLFNCPEGIQRYCFSNRVKLVNMENVFITDLDWQRVGGILGLSLTVQSFGAVELALTSGEGIQDLFHSTKSFMSFTSGIKCYTKTHRDGAHIDNGISILPIPLDQLVQVENSPSSSPNSQEPTIKRIRPTVKLISYLCELPDLPGALDPQKCRELGVPVGPLLGKLKSGSDITLSDGRLVKSTDVCGPKNPGPKFLIVECTTESDIPKLFANETLSKLRSDRDSSNTKEICFVAHFSPLNILQHSRYKEWMDGFSERCKHLILSKPDEKTQINFVDCYRFQYLLRKIDDVIFPKLALTENFIQRAKVERTPIDSKTGEHLYQDELINDTVEQTFVKGTLKEMDRVFSLAALDKIVLRPNDIIEGFDSKIRIDSYYNEAALHPQLQEHLTELKELQKDLPEAKDYEPELVFLGTGSALPSKLRATASILINFTYPEPSSVILDCSEDTYGQLCRRFGLDRTCDILKNLKIIYISHQHADHHVGLLKVLNERAKLTSEPVAVFLPPGLEILVNYHNQNFNDIRHTYQIHNTKLLKSYPKLSQDEKTMRLPAQATRLEIINQLDGLLIDYKIVDVDHCANSCAAVFKFKIGHEDMETFTVAYSGDARPSEEFAMIGKGCDLLIHEATFDHRSTLDAIKKKHSTCDEAIEVSKQMGAKFTVLTHFSQRLAKIPIFTDKFDDKIGFAFDNLTLRCPSHLCRLPILKPILSHVFEKSLLENDEKIRKQERRSENIRRLLNNQY